jgi:phosphate transport system permease protein
MVLPVVIIAAQEAIRAVPGSLREAAYGVGATRWQVVRHHVLPVAMPGILTGMILSLSRAIGETAPVIMVGALAFVAFDPTSPLDQFTVMPMQIYNWTSRPQADFHGLAAAAIVVLVVLLLLMNATAILLRNRYQSRRG